MSTTVAVLVNILLQQGLFALGWAVLALLRLSRRATLHWALATAAISMSLVLVVLRDQLPAWIGFWLSPMAALLAFVLIRRGVLHFVRAPLADLEHAALLGLVAPALAAAVVSGTYAAVMVVSSSSYGYVLLRAGWSVHRGLRAEFGSRWASGCALPMLAIGAMFVVRAATALWRPEAVGHSLHSPTLANEVSVIGFLVAGLLLNLGLLALVMARMTLRLLHLSERDGLTGLLNRRAIERRLAAEAERLARYRQPYSVLSIDVDHFKTINDRHGHPAGDAVLQAMGATLSGIGRSTDQAARTGGEEFWLLMPSTHIDGASQAAVRLLRAVREMRVLAAQGEVALTVSIGVAVADRPEEPLDRVLQRLDAALYRAKQSGRDRIELAVPGIDDLAPAAAPQGQAA